MFGEGSHLFDAWQRGWRGGNADKNGVRISLQMKKIKLEGDPPTKYILGLFSHLQEMSNFVLRPGNVDIKVIGKP